MTATKRPQQQGAVSPDRKSSSSRQPDPRLSKRRRWWFRIGALLLPVMLIVITEGLLVALNVGDDLSLFTWVAGNPERLPCQVNPRAEESYFAGRSLAGPEPRRFDLPRPDGVFRIVVVGGSTVLGFPYPPELSFPRQLEVLLGQQNPDERFEVINTGMVAINSFSVADVVTQCLAMQPDLIIVHTGHNEFYGPGGVASTSTMAPLAVKVRRLRLFQLAARWLVDEPPNGGDLMEQLPASVAIARSDSRYDTAQRSYRENLEQIVATASTAGIPVVLTTVASNLSNHSPVSFLIPENLSAGDLEQWRVCFDEGQRLTLSARWQEALEQLEQARAISGESSLLHYRMGQCLEGLQQYSESRAEFELARDLDGCRFRAPGPFRDIVRDVATQAAGRDVYFVDSAEQLAVEAGPATPGDNLFLEHVHYNLEGHRQLAMILSRFVQQQVLQRQWDATAVPEDARFDELLALLPEDRLSGLSYALRVMTVFPMSKTVDVVAHREALVARITQELGSLDAEQQQLFTDLSLDDMAVRLPAALADRYRSNHQHARELYYRRCDVIRHPWEPDAIFRLARCLADAADRRAEAIEYCQQALQLDPQHAPSMELLSRLNSSPPQE